MDAPPDKEDSRPFVQVAGNLQQMNLNGVRVLQADLENGILLLTDLGSTQYLSALEADRNRGDALYADAINALLRMQVDGEQVQGDLPPFDEKLLRFELSLFSDWLCGTHLGLEFDTTEKEQWSATCNLLVDNALEQPIVFVHRDYHSRNLMVTERNNPGILDFQDAVAGPYTYDLVSLLKDCYIEWPLETVERWALAFHQARKDLVDQSIDAELFLRHFDLMGVQRHLKAAGIFARLNHRDNKPLYMLDVPRTLNYILAIAGRYEELAFLAELISERVLPELAAVAA
jgi:aminoglycoside/choline kinase family phosphotransferase